MRDAGRRLLTCLVLVATSSCMGSPTPLAPGLHGSVGLPHHGTLDGGLELPKSGPGFVRYRPLAPRNYGTRRLVEGLQRAAAFALARSGPGAPLVIGDLSAVAGGFVSGHASHRTGRDVDLLLFLTTTSGIPRKSPGFVHIGADGLVAVPGEGYLLLDVERQWQLVRALLTDHELDVLWMFVSRDIEALLITHARGLGEPLDLLWRAEQVLHQPRDSANHDDHIHLRIACGYEERLAGCDSGGPNWPWLPDNPELPLSSDELAELAAESPPEP